MSGCHDIAQRTIRADRQSVMSGGRYVRGNVCTTVCPVAKRFTEQIVYRSSVAHEGAEFFRFQPNGQPFRIGSVLSLTRFSNAIVIDNVFFVPRDVIAICGARIKCKWR